MALTLFDFPLSGHAHRVRLFLALAQIDAKIEAVDLANGAHKSPEFLQKNSFGQVPVLQDDDVYISDSNAILVYLARKFDKQDWYPQDPKKQADIQRWLSVAAGQIAFGPAAARLVTLFGASFNIDEVIARAHQILPLIDQTLAQSDYITGKQATIADIALYSYIAAAPEGNVDLSDYTHVTQWMTRLEALPHFEAMPESPVGLRQSA